MNNIDRIDWLTSIASRVLDILLMKYPTRTGLGLVLGGFFSFAVQLFAPALRSIKYMDFAGSPWWGWLLLGVLIFHLPTRPHFPPSARNPSAMIRLIRQWS